jgi:putative ABC transport system ATP-binding protein
VSFSLNQGESLAVVGASGSGKSTLLGLIAGLDTPSSGEVKAMGTSLFSLDEDQRAQWRAAHLGFVFQSFQLLPQMTALENVMLPAELAGKTDAAMLAQQWLEKVGLGDRLSHYPRTLSGGEQQRVAIARAFCAQPALLFADEPTGSLDTQTAARVIDLLFDLNQSAGTTLILVTHDPALAQRCQRQIVIQAGKIV